VLLKRLKGVIISILSSLKEEHKMEDYDVIIVGAGPAGLSAALFTGVMNLRALVLEAEKPPKLWSYPRRTFLLEGISGAEFIQKIVEQAKRCEVEIHTEEKAIDVELKKRKIVKTQRKSYECDALILATGARWKKLNVPGETWLARGTSYCAICDGPFFKDCNVIVAGSGNDAVEEALVLSQVAHKVTLVTNSTKVKAEPLVEKLRRKRVSILEGYKVEAIERRELFNDVKLRSMKTGETNVVQAEGVFIALGVEPTSLKVEKIGVKTHRQGGIIVDSRQQTNIEGVFAAGDCTCGSGFHMTPCVGDGIKAGLAAYLYVKRLRRIKA